MAKSPRPIRPTPVSDLTPAPDAAVPPTPTVTGQPVADRAPASVHEPAASATARKPRVRRPTTPAAVPVPSAVPVASDGPTDDPRPEANDTVPTPADGAVQAPTATPGRASRRGAAGTSRGAGAAGNASAGASRKPDAGGTPRAASRPRAGTPASVRGATTRPAASIPDAMATRPRRAPARAAAAPVEAIHGVAPAEAAPAGAPPVGTSGARASLRILMVASEAVPFAKSGGLADVVAALPKALGVLGHQVTVALPRYRGVPVDDAPTMTFPVAMGGHDYQAEVFVQQAGPGVRVALIDHPAFFDRDGLYGVGSHDYADNPRRFAFLSLAALEFARREGQPIDVVHAHDWQGGLTPVYLKTRYATDPVLGGAASVFTIHNIAYQGLCASDWLPRLGLGWEVFTVDGLEFWLQVSLLKGGIMFSDVVTTVSRRYAEELMTAEFAFGFEGILRHRAADFVGVLNGIDAEIWNPANDPYLPRPYSGDDLSGKIEAKRVLLDTFGLPGGDHDLQKRPVVAMISRMVDQKGLDLIAAVAEQLPHLGAAFTILGTGEPAYEEMWRSLARRYPDRVGVRIGFDEPLSHVMEAGADLFMMPSRFEPCGLNQMYSLRYGTVPVVRATGGLHDTVQNYDPATGAGNGFSFSDVSGDALLGTLRWALQLFQNDPERWRGLQRAGMARDFSWEASARVYVETYARARSRVTARPRGIARA